MALVSGKLLLRARPYGQANSDHFRMVEEPVGANLSNDQVLVRVEFISVSPAMRGLMNCPQQALCEVLPAQGVGIVVKSGSKQFNPGDLVLGNLGTQSLSLMYINELTKLPAGSNPIPALTTFGLESLAAYFGLTKFGNLKPGNTVVVSSAAGACGSAAVQIAKSKGCKVIGIAGSDAKCRYVLDTLKADACINYKTTTTLSKDLQSQSGTGIDVYFDTVGGNCLNAVLLNMKDQGRVVLCGSLRNMDVREPLARVIECVMRNLTLTGFKVQRFAEEFPSAIEELQKIAGFHVREQILEGLEQLPRALRMLITGDNQGKILLKVSTQPRL